MYSYPDRYEARRERLADLIGERVDTAHKHRESIAAALAALDAAVAAAKAARVPCPLAGFDFEDITNSADMMTVADYDTYCAEHFEEELLGEGV